MSESPQRRERGSTTARARAVIVGLVLVYLVLFVVLNTRRVKISFVFFTVRTLILFALVVVAVLSFAAGYLARARRGGRRS